MNSAESVFSEDARQWRKDIVDFAFRPLAFYLPNPLDHDLGYTRRHLKNLCRRFSRSLRALRHQRANGNRLVHFSKNERREGPTSGERVTGAGRVMNSMRQASRPHVLAQTSQ
jgi:hypothetical protein